MKTKRLTSIILALVLFFTSFSTMPTSAAAKTKKTHIYISMTQSQIGKSSRAKVRNTYLELNTKKAKNTCTYNPTAKYQLSLYDRRGKKTYFLADYKGNDNIYVRSRGKTRRLCNKFYSVNNIYQINNKLFLIAVKKNETAVSPFIYDIKNKKLTRLDKKSRNVNAAGFSSTSNEFFFSSFSYKEAQRISDEFNSASGDDRIMAIPGTVYSVNKKGKKEKLFTTAASVESIAGNKNYIIYTTVKYKGWYHNGLDDVKDIRETFIYNRKTKNTQKIKNIKHKSNVENSDFISLEGKNSLLFYESGSKGSKIIRYNIKTGKRKTLYSVKGYRIDNASLIK